jgi:hypothetical protein
VGKGKTWWDNLFPAGGREAVPAFLPDCFTVSDGYAVRLHETFNPLPDGLFALGLLLWFHRHASGKLAVMFASISA